MCEYTTFLTPLVLGCLKNCFGSVRREIAMLPEDINVNKLGSRTEPGTEITCSNPIWLSNEELRTGTLGLVRLGLLLPKVYTRAGGHRSIM
jgi:hypothetical protein